MTAAEKVTAAHVREALRRRWPDSEYLTINEAPDGPDRMGRKLDAVVVSLWRSRGYTLDGVEIKVSTGDWMREVNNPGKADWWWKHVDRFWIAVPVAIAPKVRQLLPDTWGLLATNGAGCQVVVQAPKHQAEPLTWPQCVGLLRATADAGPGALARAEDRGYRRGVEVGKLAAVTQGTEARGLALHDELRAQVAAFEKASGIRISDRWPGAEGVGKLVAHVLRNMAGGDPSRRLLHLSDTMRREADEVTRLAALYEQVLQGRGG